jgi:hypothetical protein
LERNTMIGALMGLPGKCKAIYDHLTTYWTSTKSGYLDASITSRTSNSVWTNALATELDGLAPSIAAIPTTPINSIQAFTITMTSVASNTATITAVTVAKSVVIFTGFSCDASAAGAGLHHVMSRATLTNTTTVTATRGAATGVVTVSGFVVEFK